MVWLYAESKMVEFQQEALLGNYPDSEFMMPHIDGELRY
jgi:hypothetical protein